MSEKVNHLAEAIADQIASDDNTPADLARAAIAAMHEPTPEMIEAGAKILGDESGAGRWNALCCWHAMHAEMLK